MLMYTLWFVIGLIAVWPLLAFANRRPDQVQTKLFGRCLVIAAVIYLIFALMWGNMDWVVVELAGIGVYGLFYLLALRYSIFWLALGWLLHPVWDVLLHLFGPGSHVAPEWYAVACMSFDIATAGYIVWRMKGMARKPHSPN